MYTNEKTVKYLKKYEQIRTNDYQTNKETNYKFQFNWNRISIFGSDKEDIYIGSEWH